MSLSFPIPDVWAGRNKKFPVDESCFEACKLVRKHSVGSGGVGGEGQIIPALPPSYPLFRHKGKTTGLCSTVRWTTDYGGKKKVN